ncbi:MAG TPA: DUF2207 domain-containing protein [Patescibacteria group bacterium]|nr:DUF2207 domain-containing protein [Patescibacteria group bacterium]
MKKVLIFILALFCLVFPLASHAQDSEHIEKYDTSVAIRKDGTIHVAERIEYFFDSPRHGIFRDIPTIKTNADGKKYRMTISGESVTDETNGPYTFTVTQNGDTEELKIGDADRTITGTHHYVITYDVAGALTYFPGHDELYWNAVGTQWTVPVSEASVIVRLPQAVAQKDLNVTCFVGVEGATGKDCTASHTDSSVTVTATLALTTGEGVTVVVGFPKGMVAVLEPKEVVPFFATLAGKITLLFIIIVAIFWYIAAPVLVIRKWWVSGRDPKPAMGEAAAWFSPPKNQKLRDLTPAETGTLVDESADLRDIYATLVDLARRGYMKIIETKKTVFFSKTTGYDFQKQKDWKNDPGVQPFEKELLDAIFEDGDRVSLKDLDLHDTFEKVKTEVYTSLVTDGFFPENPQSVRTKYYVLAFFALFTGNLILFLVALLFGKNMPRKTQAGAEAAAVARSLKNFLVSQNRELAFQAKNQMMFEKLLPFAVAFGVEEIWAARFKNLALKQPKWYVASGNGPFNAVFFAQSIGRSASVSFASSVMSKSSSGFSSGFSGGGFSGGGGGGGGGGSW